MTQYGSIETRIGAIRVSRTRFAGRERLDIREFYKDHEGELKPTRKGVSLLLEDLPRLAAALAAAEHDAIVNGLLLAEDYTNNDLVPPAELDEAA